jgi:hypothetical protein
MAMVDPTDAQNIREGKEKGITTDGHYPLGVI